MTPLPLVAALIQLGLARGQPRHTVLVACAPVLLALPTVTPLAIRKTVLVSRSQARDFRVYEKLRDKAQSRGQELRIVDDQEFQVLTGNQEPEPPEPAAQGVTERPDGTKFYAVPRALARSNNRAYVYAKDEARKLGLDVEFTDGPDAA